MTDSLEDVSGIIYSWDNLSYYLAQLNTRFPNKTVQSGPNNTTFNSYGQTIYNTNYDPIPEEEKAAFNCVVDIYEYLLMNNCGWNEHIGFIKESESAYRNAFYRYQLSRSAEVLSEMNECLDAWQSRASGVFWLIYNLWESMELNKQLILSAQQYMPEMCAKFTKLLREILIEFLPRTIVARQMHLAMKQGKHYKLTLRCLLSTEVTQQMKASACPFAMNVRSPSLPTEDSLDGGIVDQNFEMSFLRPSVESYKLSLSGDETDSQNPTGSRKRPTSSNEASMSPLYKNRRDFQQMSAGCPLASGNNNNNYCWEADFSTIVLTQISKDAQAERKNLTQNPPRKNAAESVFNKLSKAKPKAQPTGEVWYSVGEIPNYIFITVKFDFGTFSAHVYKKLPIPIGMITYGDFQTIALGSSIWTIMTSLSKDETACLPDDGIVCHNDAQHGLLMSFVAGHFNGLINVLTAEKLPKASAESGIGAKPAAAEGQYDENLDPKSPPPVPNFVNLTEKQKRFLCEKLRRYQNHPNNDYVTRSQFLGILNDPERSWFSWFFYTCQAIGQNLGLKQICPPGWFGNPKYSVWHNNFVVGYISSEAADRALLSLLVETKHKKYFVLIRWSDTKKQSFVVHLTTDKPAAEKRFPEEQVVVQMKPVEVGVDLPLDKIMQQPEIATHDYQIVTYDADERIRLIPKTRFQDWVNKATVTLSPVSLTKQNSTKLPCGCDSHARYQCGKARLLAESARSAQLYAIMENLHIQPQSPDVLADKLELIRNFNCQTDPTTMLRVVHEIREIPELSEIVAILRRMAKKPKDFNSDTVEDLDDH